MSRAKKRLARMRNNPQDDWQISDVESVCSAHGIDCKPPTGGGSHFTVSHPSQKRILTVPAHRPIGIVYIVQLVLFIDAVVKAES